MQVDHLSIYDPETLPREEGGKRNEMSILDGDYIVPH